MRRSLIITATTCLAAAGAGLVGLSPAPAVAASRASAAARGLAWVRAASAASVRGTHGPAVRLAPMANNPNVQQIDHLLPAGHLGGRKQAVVLDIRDTRFGAASGTVGITARSGRTGHAYWHVAYPGSFIQGTDVLVEPLGAKGVRGVLVEQFTNNPDPIHTNDFDDDLQVTALSGTSGSVLWTQAFDGISDSNTFAETDIARAAEPFRDTTRKAIDFLVPVDTTLTSTEDQTQGELMSGVDGSVQNFGGTFAVDNEFPTETVVPDLNRDGFQDVVVDSQGSSVQALSGASPMAVQLWTSAIAPDATTQVGVIPDYSHKNVPDVSLMSYRGGVPRFQLTVLGGETGKLLWQRNADDMLTIGKAGAHKTPAVMLARLTTATSTAKDTTTWHYAAVTPANKVLYSRQVGAVVDNPGGSGSFSHVSIAAIGDVNGDGSADVHVTIDNEPEYTLVAGGSSAPVRTVHAKSGIINGRNGDFHSVVFDSPADGSLHKGALTDLLQTHADKGKTRVEAFRGSTRKRYYSRLVKTLSGTQAAWSFGARLTGHSCSDIALIAQVIPPTPGILGNRWHSASTAVRGEAAVLSARGARLWAVTFSVKQAVGGTLTHFKKPKHFCV